MRGSPRRRSSCRPEMRNARPLNTVSAPERRDERQDADIGHQNAVRQAADQTDRERRGDGEPRAGIRRRTPVAATMPARLAIEPTLRSKSPIAMTIVIVKDTTASMLTCCVMLRRLREVTKVSGRDVQKKTKMTTKPISVPYWRTAFSIGRSALRLAVAERQQPLGRQTVGWKNGADSSLAHDGDARAEVQNLLVIRGDDQNAGAGARQVRAAARRCRISRRRRRRASARRAAGLSPRRPPRGRTSPSAGCRPTARAPSAASSPP